jgi:hypothetical protein
MIPREDRAACLRLLCKETLAKVTDARADMARLQKELGIEDGRDTSKMGEIPERVARATLEFLDSLSPTSSDVRPRRASLCARQHVEELAALCEAASPGPWSPDPARNESAADAAFIAAARTALPRLLEERRLLLPVVDAARALRATGRPGAVLPKLEEIDRALARLDAEALGRANITVDAGYAKGCPR